MAKSLTEKMLDKLAKKLDGSFATLSGDAVRSGAQGVIPTGIAAVDHYLIGCGGIPCGAKGITEAYSEEGGGKSSLLYATIARAQGLDYPVALWDTEYSVTAERVQTFGVNPDFVAMPQADTIEECFSQFEDMLDAMPAGNPCLLAWDSLAATPTLAEVKEGLTGKDSWDTRAKTISHSLRVLTQKIAAKSAAFFVINQPRQKIGVMFGDKTTTPGGQALKSTASLRLHFFPGAALKRGEEKVGRYITIVTKKNRFAPPRKVKVLLMFESGFDDAWSTINLAKELDLIPPTLKGEEALHAAARMLSSKYPSYPTTFDYQVATDTEELNEEQVATEEE